MGWASEDALMGFGMPPQLASLVGDNPAVFAGAGTSQTGATVIRNNSAEITAASSQTALLLQHVELNMPVFVFNSSATTALVFCPSGTTLNGSSNASLSVAQNKAAMFWEYKKGAWASVLTA